MPDVRNPVHGIAPGRKGEGGGEAMRQGVVVASRNREQRGSGAAGVTAQSLAWVVKKTSALRAQRSAAVRHGIGSIIDLWVAPAGVTAQSLA